MLQSLSRSRVTTAGNSNSARRVKKEGCLAEGSLKRRGRLFYRITASTTCYLRCLKFHFVKRFLPHYRSIRKETQVSRYLYLFMNLKVHFFFFTIPLIDIFEDRLEKFLNLIKFTAPSVKKLFSSSDNFSS